MNPYCNADNLNECGREPDTRSSSGNSSSAGPSAMMRRGALRCGPDTKGLTMHIFRTRPLLNRREIMLAATLAAVSDRRARAYPNRPIRVIVANTPGGVPDWIMRLLAPHMEEALGQKLVMEAKPGAAGTIAMLEVAHAPTDGSTLLVAPAHNFVINQYLIRMPVDPLTALAPIAKLTDVPLVLFSNAAVPARTLPEFIAHARANPGRLRYGSPGIGSVNHLFIERLRQAAGIQLTHVPYRGGSQAMLGLLSNEIQLFAVGLAAAAGHLDEGKLLALAAATEERLPLLPQVPTVIEAGFAGYTASNWWGMAAPGGTPTNIIEMLREAVVTAVGQPGVGERFANMGLLRPGGTREDFIASLQAEANLWSDLIRRAKIVIE
jgi:tripartite-type tricarboxylate transporter receptor subunit TctC